MSEPDCFLRYRMHCNAEFYYVGEIPRIGIGRLSLQRCVVLKRFYSPRAARTTLSEVHALHRVPFYVIIKTGQKRVKLKQSAKIGNSIRIMMLNSPGGSTMKWAPGEVSLKPRSQMRWLYAMAMFFCLSVRSFVACEIFKVIRYIAAPGGERGLVVSTPIHLFYIIIIL